METENCKHECMPIGLAMSLAQNPDAVNNFSALSPQTRTRILEKARNVTSKDEMIRIVSAIANNRIK